MMSVVCLASGRANTVCRFNLKSSLETLLASPSYSCHTFPRRRHRATLQQGVRLPVVSAAGESDYPAESPVVAVEGDLVTVHWDCIGEEGEVRSAHGHFAMCSIIYSVLSKTAFEYFL